MQWIKYILIKDTYLVGALKELQSWPKFYRNLLMQIYPNDPNFAKSKSCTIQRLHDPNPARSKFCMIQMWQNPNSAQFKYYTIQNFHDPIFFTILSIKDPLWWDVLAWTWSEFFSYSSGERLRLSISGNWEERPRTAFDPKSNTIPTDDPWEDSKRTLALIGGSGQF